MNFPLDRIHSPGCFKSWTVCR